MNLSWIQIATLAAMALWLIAALVSAFNRSRFPKSGMRKSEMVLLVATLLVAVPWVARIDFSSFRSESAVAASAAATTTTTRGSCATLDNGMTSAEVKSKMGQPDETLSNEETRGPGATMLVYRSSRCVVHLFDDKVDFIE
jgi:hypothetical protein